MYVYKSRECTSSKKRYTRIIRLLLSSTSIYSFYYIISIYYKLYKREEFNYNNLNSNSN